MISKVLPYSYSSLTSFENCPFQHYKVKVAKTVEPLPFKAAQDGTDAHKLAEDYIMLNQDFDGVFAPKIKAVVTELRQYGDVQAEVKLCVTEDKQACDWRDPMAYSRGIIDVFQVTGKVARIRDWKTGKPNAFSTQLKHNSLLLMMHYPEVERVEYAYEWLKHGYATKNIVYREFLEEAWQNFERRVFKLKQALVEDKWPKKPSGLCKQYCPVTECEHNGLRAKEAQ